MKKAKKMKKEINSNSLKTLKDQLKLLGDAFLTTILLFALCIMIYFAFTGKVF